MLLYKVDVFDRKLNFVFNGLTSIPSIDDDYISPAINSIELPATDLIKSGYFIRLESELFTFFGLITDASPGENITIVQFRSFISIFDEDFLFDRSLQYSAALSHQTLEETMEKYIQELYVTNSDSFQNLPIIVSVDPSITQTERWALGMVAERDDTDFCIGSLYQNMIVTALKKYGVVIDVIPDLSNKVIKLRITKKSGLDRIDADLKNVFLKTLKYKTKNSTTNKLVVYNTDDFSQSITFYVHNDDTWDAEDRDRVTPVIREVRSVTPDAEISDPSTAFASAAVDVAYSTISGSAYDNLIELDSYIGDPIVKPEKIPIGKIVSIWYKGAKYTSILTGRKINNEQITLLFGSERIEYSKRVAMNGGKT